jgi:putative nucleotidyltransferase with HDIG domain
MNPAASSEIRITQIDWGAEPGPEAFERFYRELTDRDDLPTIPEVARHLMVAVNQQSTTAKHLADLIGRDPSLTANLLRLANSAFFGLQRRVTDIRHAVTLLGFTTVRDLVMTLSLWGTIGDRDPTTRLRRKLLWAHCAGVGALAKLLAKKVGKVDAGEALSAGLLHDIGKLLLGLRLGTTYWDMLDDVGVGNPTGLEEEAFRIHHGTVGQYLLQLWGLPATLSEAVSRHHEPLVPESSIGVWQVVNAANRILPVAATGNEEEAITILDALAPGRFAEDGWTALRDDLEAEQALIAGFLGNA